MLLNSVPLNGASLGSGGGVVTVLGAADLVVTVAGQFKATVVAYAKATQAASVSGVQHSVSLLRGTATSISEITGTAYGAAYKLISGYISQAVSADVSASAVRTRIVRSSTTTLAGAVGLVTGRLALRSSATQIASGYGTITARVLTAIRATATCTAFITSTALCQRTQSGKVASAICRVVATGYSMGLRIPRTPAPEERTFSLTTGDRSFVLTRN